MSTVHFDTIPPIVLIPQETTCYICKGTEADNPRKEKWAHHRAITDQTGCQSPAHVACMKSFIANRVRLHPESELVCPCTSLIVKFDGEYVGSLYGHLKAAVAENNEAKIQEIFTKLALENNKKIQDGIWASAAENNDKTTLEKLIDSPLASARTLGIALHWVSVRGHFECLELLLGTGLISEEEKLLDTVSAAESGHFKCLKLLLTLEDGSISKAGKILITSSSIKGNNEECLRFLLTGRESFGMSNKGIQAYITALLEEQKLSKQEQIEIFFGALRANNLAIAQMLLDKKSISREVLNLALIHCKNLDHIPLLLSTGLATEDTIGEKIDRLNPVDEKSLREHRAALTLLIKTGLCPSEKKVLLLCRAMLFETSEYLEYLQSLRELIPLKLWHNALSKSEDLAKCYGSWNKIKRMKATIAQIEAKDKALISHSGVWIRTALAIGAAAIFYSLWLTRPVTDDQF